jgi:hypothetical protein
VVLTCPFLFHQGSKARDTITCANSRELRVKSGRSIIRVFYAFNPARTAILLIGGDKRGDKRFYEKMVPVADRLYDVHIEELKKEGLIK